MDWRKIVVRNELVGSIQDQFGALQMLARAPKDFSLWSDKGMDATTTLYFSPGSVRLAGSILDKYGAIPCPEPKDAIPLVSAE